MLYHWHEIDKQLASATDGVDVHRDAAALPRPPIIRYDAETARAQARGTPFQIDDAHFAVKPANDQRADKLAMRLREAGLGLVGEPRHRANPGHYDLMQRSFRFLRSSFRSFVVCLTDALERLAWKPGRGVSSCSHTMVSNSTDYAGRTRDDAQRQRFSASIG